MILEGSWTCALSVNISTPNLVQNFALDRLLHDLEATPQASDCSSLTSNDRKTLTEGRKRLLYLWVEMIVRYKNWGILLVLFVPYVNDGAFMVFGLKTH